MSRYRMRRRELRFFRRMFPWNWFLSGNSGMSDHVRCMAGGRPGLREALWNE